MTSTLLNDKRGSIQDVVFTMVGLIAFGIVILVVLHAVNQFNNEWQSNSVVPQNSKNIASSATTKITTAYDGMMLFAVVLISMITIGLAAAVPVNAVFLPFFIIGLVFVTFLSGAASEAYTEMSVGEMASTSATLPITSTILKGLPIIVTVLGVIVMIAMFKARNKI